MVSSGKEGCNCVDRSATLSSIANDRPCTTPSGDDGVLLSLQGTCVPYSYGSGGCLQHDLIDDPACQNDPEGSVVPAYCFQPWCFVDRDECKRESSEAIYASKYFTSEHADLFYSYTTCGASVESWNQYEQEQNWTASSLVMGGVPIYATVPSFQMPQIFKTDPDNGEIILESRGEAYYNDKIPFEGIYMSYVKGLVQLSNGDIKDVSYTHVSRASDERHPLSRYTAAVQDIENGIVDMAVAGFWVTAERLNMTTFTIPVFYDKTFLVIPRPQKDQSFQFQVEKLAQPFSWWLWAVICIIITVAGLLSFWFADCEKIAQRNNRKSVRQVLKKRKKSVYLRLIIDSFLEKWLFFFNAGIEQDQRASLPEKLLMFGFGGFILVTVSAYVANLAAFLTQSGTEKYIGTMEEAVATGAPICAHPALSEEMKIKWPEANFQFDDSGNEAFGVLEKYERGDCKMIALGRGDNFYDMKLINKLCELDLVVTRSLVIETPVAFPIKPELASGFSYWIYQGEKYNGISIPNLQNAWLKNKGGPECKIEFTEQDYQESDDFASVTLANMVLPITLFIVCAILAVILQIIHECYKRKDMTSLIGTACMIEKFVDEQSRSLAHDSTHSNYPSIENQASQENRIVAVSFKDGLPKANSVQLNDSMNGKVVSKASMIEKCVDEPSRNPADDSTHSDHPIAENQASQKNRIFSVSFKDGPGQTNSFQLNDSMNDEVVSKMSLKLRSLMKGSMDDLHENGSATLTPENGELPIVENGIGNSPNQGVQSAIDDVLKCLEDMNVAVKRLKKTQ